MDNFDMSGFQKGRKADRNGFKGKWEMKSQKQ